MQKVLIIGATSAIAEAFARRLAEQGERLYLMARNKEKITAIAADLTIRGAESVNYSILDFNNFYDHRQALDQAIGALEGLDIVLIAHGTLPDQKSCENDFGITLRELNSNAISTLSLLTRLADYMEQRKSGTIAVISSVAGDRGRQSNYVYGAAKGMTTIFLQGLRNRLQRSGVRVMTIKPGFVDTPMTKDFKKGLLWATPEQVAGDILKGIRKQRDVLYTPFFWRYIMLIIKAIPEKIFKKLSL
ncbi:MAG: SDR family oxidoreductase [Desulfobulbaceae bacterium]|nr:SDR family oxidoreductase [Desulfobulbaceae bacterium]